MQKKGKCSGLTFVEMVLATAMVSIIAIAVYGMIANGLKVWLIVNQESPQIDSTLLFEKMDLDFKNAVCFKGIEFSGNQTSVCFACVSGTAVSNNGFNQGIGEVKYYYEQSSRSFNRQYIDYEQLSASKQPESRSLINNINNGVFKYYFFDQQKKAFLWSNIWPPESFVPGDNQALPLAVQVSMVIGSEKTLTTLTKTLNIPIGGIEFKH
jgi:hypothetical protein